MQSITYFSLSALLTVFLTFSSLLFAEEIDFSDEALAKEILLKTWTCELTEKWHPGPNKWKFVEINKRKLQGTIFSEFCPSKPGVIKGKLKKNKFKFSTDQPDPCADRAGHLEFSYKDKSAGIVIAKGAYRQTNYDTNRKGTLYCYSLF